MAAAEQEPPQQNVRSFIVPRWLAGTWKSSCETVVHVFDYTTGQSMTSEPFVVKAQRIHSIGNLMDKNGNIWHRTTIPYTRMVEGDGFTEYQFIDDLRLVSAGSDYLSVQTHSQVSRITNDSMAPGIFFNESTLATYRNLKDGIMQVEFAIEDFDMDGKPVCSSRKICVERRVDRFRNDGRATDVWQSILRKFPKPEDLE